MHTCALADHMAVRQVCVIPLLSAMMCAASLQVRQEIDQARSCKDSVWIALQNLLGDPGTRRSLRRAVSRLIRLRRYEHMSVQHALHGVRPSQMQALLPGD